MEKILILGNGGHAKSLVDTLEREGKYKIAGYVVNSYVQSATQDYPVIGNDDDLRKIFDSGIINAAIGIGYLGNSELREELWQKIKKIGFFCPIIRDVSAIISSHVQIGEGSFIGKGAIVNKDVIIGRMCIINTGAIIEHDCLVEDFSHISVGSILCGNVQVGKASFIGAKATIIQGRTIGSRCIIGAGETIKSNIIDGGKT